MKRFYILLALLGCAATANAVDPHGILTKAVNKHTYGIDLFLQDNPTITYASLARPEMSAEQKAMFVQNLRKWPQETLQIIRQRGRETEFADIMPYLTNELTIKEVPFYEPTDVMVTWDPANKSASGYFVHQSEQTQDLPSVVYVSPNEQNRFDEITLHEIGHFYGLADDYLSGRGNAHPEYSGEVSPCGSIMQEVGRHGPHLTYDDADGFIRLIDLRLAQRNGGKFTGRARKGWKSLCPLSNKKYQNGRSVNRNEYDGNGNGYILRYKKGKLIQEGWPHFPQTNVFDLFGIAAQDTVTKDEAGRIRAIKAPFQMTFTDRDGESHQETVTLERSFNYRPDTTRGGYYIDVKRLINGAVEREFRFLVIANKLIYIKDNFEDERNTFTSSHYKSVGFAPSYEYGNFAAELTLDNFQPVAAEISVSGHGYYRNGKLIVRKDGQTWQGQFRAENKNKNVVTYAVALTPQLQYEGNINEDEMRLLKLLILVHKDNVSYVRNFYEQFYLPLIGNGNQERQIQETLQQRISARN